MSSAKPRVLLAYSGGLDTSIICKWLQEKYEVVCFSESQCSDPNL